MSKIKEQLAATLLNHVHVVEQSLSLGRRSRRPTSPRYKEVAELNYDDSTAVNEVIKSFIAFNSKHFIENLRFVVDDKVKPLEAFEVSWAPKILIRGLAGKISAKQLPYDLAIPIVQAMTFSRQNAEVSSALELAGGVTPANVTFTGVDLMIPAYKNSPYCNLQREQEDFIKGFNAKLLILRAVSMVASGLTSQQKDEVVAGRANISVSIDDTLTPVAFSLEETDAARAQRLARERLEEARRRRTMGINSVTITNNQINYDLSPLIAADEHLQLSVQVETLLGW